MFISMFWSEIALTAWCFSSWLCEISSLPLYFLGLCWKNERLVSLKIPYIVLPRLFMFHKQNGPFFYPALVSVIFLMQKTYCLCCWVKLDFLQAHSRSLVLGHPYWRPYIVTFHWESWGSYLGVISAKTIRIIEWADI